MKILSYPCKTTKKNIVIKSHFCRPLTCNSILPCTFMSLRRVSLKHTQTCLPTRDNLAQENTAPCGRFLQGAVRDDLWSFVHSLSLCTVRCSRISVRSFAVVPSSVRQLALAPRELDPPTVGYSFRSIVPLGIWHTTSTSFR